MDFSRSNLTSFSDVADDEIIGSREKANFKTMYLFIFSQEALLMVLSNNLILLKFLF
jgi:hypothetical protein